MIITEFEDLSKPWDGKNVTRDEYGFTNSGTVLDTRICSIMYCDQGIWIDLDPFSNPAKRPWKIFLGKFNGKNNIKN
jgi:hypothetical protein